MACKLNWLALLIYVLVLLLFVDQVTSHARSSATPRYVTNDVGHVTKFSLRLLIFAR